MFDLFTLTSKLFYFVQNLGQCLILKNNLYTGIVKTVSVFKLWVLQFNMVTININIVLCSSRNVFKQNVR